MKTSRILHSILRMTMLLTLIIAFASCQKSEKLQTFNDIFDTSGIDALNAQIAAAKTIGDLPVEFSEASFKVPEGIMDIDVKDLATWYQQNIQLSETEVDLLLRNDSRTYIDVINRMAAFPPQMGQLKAEDFNELKSSSLNKYLLRKVDEPENFYSTDYYSAVIALQDYIQCSVIDPLSTLSNLTSIDVTGSYTVGGQMLNGCETAFACGTSGVCFLADFSRWGWSNPISPNETPYVLPLYAGAANCDLAGKSAVGTVTVTYPGGATAPNGTGMTMTVTYDMYPGYYLDEAHVYVGCGQYPTNNGMTVAPGQYTFNASGLGMTDGLTVTFTGLSGCVYVIAHGVTCTGNGSGTKTYGPIARNLMCDNICTPFPPAYILYFKLITSNNIWDMWWTYWSDGSRTKHKGAAGSFPGM